MPHGAARLRAPDGTLRHPPSRRPPHSLPPSLFHKPSTDHHGICSCSTPRNTPNLQHQPPPQVVDLYMRAKVYVDSYMTGIERQIMESSLFGAVTIVA